MPDRLAVVTGAAGGVGSACVELLQGAGYSVVGVDRKAGSAAKEHLQIDLSSATSGESIAEAIGDRPVDGLVNNAAIAVYTRIGDTPCEVWDEVIDTNLRSPFLVSKALLPNLRRRGGAIVNVSSVHADATSEGIAAYAASKGGLTALTRAMALEWAGDGIRVNCVLPGAVDTPMLREGLFRSGSTVDSLGAKHPLGRVGKPAEIAATIVFLLSDASSFITGAAVRVDGGALARLSTE